MSSFHFRSRPERGACFLLFAAVACTFAQSSTVLNLSHDLVPNGIAAQNMVPDSPATDAHPLFEAGLAYAVKNRIPTVTADRGAYYFLTLDTARVHALLNDVNNVTVDLGYSDLYFAQGQLIGMMLNGSSNVTFKNFTMDYLKLPFTQVTVTSVNTATRTIGIKQLGSYPLPSFFNAITIPAGYINDGFYTFAFRNGAQLRTTSRMETTGPLSDTSLQVTGNLEWEQSSSVGTIQPGDTIVLELRAGVAAPQMVNCTACTVQNVSVYASGFGGVFSTFGSANTVDHVQVIPRPGTDRLISTNADGIHFAHAGAGNVISNNTVRRGCDDGIAIDGQWAAIANAANTGATVPVARNSNTPLVVGTSYDFINVNDGTIVGTATIVSESPPVAQQTDQAGELINLTLDHAVNVQANFGMTPTDPNLRGSGTVIKNNLVQQETFARGIYPAGVANITVADNMIEATNGSGILIEEDEALTYGYKTGPSSGITVKNNIIDHAVGYGVPGLQLEVTGGAIDIWAYDKTFNPVQTSPLSNISVTNNFISNSPHSGIRMLNVTNGQITGNTILNYGQAPGDYLFYPPGCCEPLAQIQADFAQPITVGTSTSVTNNSNTITGSWIVNVSDADAAYRMAPESIAVAYGQNLSTQTALASSATLPTTLGGVTVTVTDSAGVSRPAGLFFASPTQIDYLIPTGTASGVARVMVGSTISAAFIAPVGPGLFAADGTGRGVAAALAIRASSNGSQVPVNVFQCAASSCTSVPMDLGQPTDVLVVELYGTGIRGRSSPSNVVAQIGGAPATVAYAGPQLQFPGLDQVNLYVPRSLAGAGEVPIILTVDGITANVVTVNIK